MQNNTFLSLASLYGHSPEEGVAYSGILFLLSTSLHSQLVKTDRGFGLGSSVCTIDYFIPKVCKPRAVGVDETPV